MRRYLAVLLIVAFAHHAESQEVKSELYEMYWKHCNIYHCINEHLPVLRRLAKQCSSVIEIGLEDPLFSTWGILQGLSESSSPKRSYLGIDKRAISDKYRELAEKLSADCGINFLFKQANDLYIELPETEMLFIDSFHTYRHLTYELEKFSPKVSKYIAMHDTSDSFGYQDEIPYSADSTVYPSTIDRNKVGLWQAVVDFLERHPNEWILEERLLNNFGFTILRRIGS